jgi:hypothetical protein
MPTPDERQDDDELVGGVKERSVAGALVGRQCTEAYAGVEAYRRSGVG